MYKYIQYMQGKYTHQAAAGPARPGQSRGRPSPGRHLFRGSRKECCDPKCGAWCGGKRSVIVRLVSVVRRQERGAEAAKLGGPAACCADMPHGRHGKNYAFKSTQLKSLHLIVYSYVIFSYFDKSFCAVSTHRLMMYLLLAKFFQSTP